MKRTTSEPEQTKTPSFKWSASSKRLAKIAVGGLLGISFLTGNMSIRSFAGYGLIGGTGYLLYRKNELETKKEEASALSDPLDKWQIHVMDQSAMPQSRTSAKSVAKAICGFMLKGWLIRTIMTV